MDTAIDPDIMEYLGRVKIFGGDAQRSDKLEVMLPL
jgi:hypothetical protein